VYDYNYKIHIAAYPQRFQCRRQTKFKRKLIKKPKANLNAVRAYLHITYSECRSLIGLISEHIYDICIIFTTGGYDTKKANLWSVA